MRNQLVAAIAVALLLTGLPGSAAQDDIQKEQWVAQYHDLQLRHSRLTRELERARNDYSRGRSSKHLRGEPKAALIEQIARLESEFAEVDRELRDFPETARRAGALPGWFRDLEDTAYEPQQPTVAIKTSRSDSSASIQDRRAAARKRRGIGQD